MLLESTGGWNKQKTFAKTEVYEAVVAVEKCVPVTRSVKVQMLENVYEVVCETNIVHGFEGWGLNEEWKELDRFVRVV